MAKYTLDVSRRGRQFEIEGMHVGDNGLRIFEFCFTSRGRPFPLPEGCTATLFALLPGGGTVYDSLTVLGDRVFYTLKGGTEESSITSASGRVECEIRLTGVGGKVLTSPKFSLFIDSVLQNDGAIEATESFSALTDALLTVKDLSETLPREFVFVYDMDSNGEPDEDNKKLFASLFEAVSNGASFYTQIQAYDDFIPASLVLVNRGIYHIVGLDFQHNEILKVIIAYTTDTSGKLVIERVSYVTAKLDLDGGLPEVTKADNDKLLQVVNGKWTAVTIPFAEGASV